MKTLRKITAALALFSLLFSCVAAAKSEVRLKEVGLCDFSKEVSRVISKHGGAALDGRTYRIIVKSELKVNALDAVDSASGYGGLQVFQFDNAASAQKALEYYGSLKCVEYVAEDKEISSDAVVNENKATAFAAVSSPTKPQADSCGLTALKEYIAENGITFDSQITVAVIDSGVDSDHEMLSGRLLSSGGNFVGGDSSEDDWGHGTHVAGIIADNTPENVKIKAYKVLNNFGTGTELQTATGVYAAVEDGVDLINLSLVISGDSEIMHDAIKSAYSAGIPVIAAAGNNARDLGKYKYSPACFFECITVMNVSDDYSKKATNSNYGAAVDIAAPGINVYSAYLNGGYRTMTGTSMSAPFVTSAASYILLSNMGKTPDEVRSILKSTRIAAVGDFEPGGLWAEFVTRELSEKPAVLFSEPSKSFNREFYLELSSTDADAEIYYKTSQTASAGYLKYTSPIYISSTVKITAFAIKKGAKMGDAATCEYTAAFSATDRYWESDLNGVVTKYKGYSSDVTVPEVIKGVKTTALKAGIFDTSGLGSVTLPDAVKSLPDNMFSGTPGIQKITANGVLTVGENAFSGCANLSEVNMPNVKIVKNGAFYRCEALTALCFPECTEAGESAFEDCASLCDTDFKKLQSAGARAFKNSGLINVDSAVLKSVGEFAFADCTKLESVSLPNITAAPNGIFSGCTALKSASLKSAVYIGDAAFYGCKKLKEAVLLNLSSMGESPFYNCKALNELYLPALEEIKDGDFNNVKVSGEMYFPNVKTVSQLAFSGASCGAVIYENVITCASFPQNAKTALPSTVLEWLSPESGTVYGGATCKETAESLGVGNTFKQLSFENCIWKNVETTAFADKKEVMFGVLGFNREYQWYNTNENAVGGGTPIEGANSKYFTPSSNDEYEYYYCKATSTDKNGESFVVYSAVLRAHTVTADKWTVIKEATCTEGGQMVRYCDRCGEVASSITLSALGHKRSTQKVYDKEPTCTEAGHYSYYCLRCGAVESSYSASALGHKYSNEWTVVTEPTCKDEGLKVRKCIRCEKYTGATVISPNPDAHSFVLTGYGESHPHCATETCSLCGATRVNKSVIRRVDGCELCLFEWTSDGDGGIILTKCYVEKPSFKVPALLGGLNVTGIGEKAFFGVKCDEIIIEEGIKSIASNAFYNCTAGEIFIPSTAVDIKDGAVIESDISFVICRENSAAQKFAVKNGLNYKTVSGITPTGACWSKTFSMALIAPFNLNGDLSEIMSFDGSAKIEKTPSYKSGETEIFGTGSRIASTYKEYGTAEYTIAVLGDLNGDGLCDVLDVQKAEKALSSKSFNGDFASELAATSGRGGEMTVEDYSLIVNAALGGKVTT